MSFSSVVLPPRIFVHPVRYGFRSENRDWVCSLATFDHLLNVMFGTIRSTVLVKDCTMVWQRKDDGISFVYGIGCLEPHVCHFFNWPGQSLRGYRYSSYIVLRIASVLYGQSTRRSTSLDSTFAVSFMLNVDDFGCFLLLGPQRRTAFHVNAETIAVCQGSSMITSCSMQTVSVPIHI